MKNKSLKSISGQTAEMYKLLLKSEKLMTAGEVGLELGIFSNAVYRLAETLEKFGCVEKLGRYPIRFRAVIPSQASEMYLLAQREEFNRKFSGKGSESLGQKTGDEKLKIAFISNRKELLEWVIKDLGYAKQEADLIVSGLEIPAEMVLQYKLAIERGVNVRVLVQEPGGEEREMYENWKRMGVKVRFCRAIEARIHVYDDRIVYLTSYKPDEKGGMGVRIEYAPIAGLIRSQFNLMWGKGEEERRGGF